MISTELREFCIRWNEKSNFYNIKELDGCFDKFFTIFVVYNKLYMEAAWFLVRAGLVRTPPVGRNIPDSYAAKECVENFLGSSTIWRAIQADPSCRISLQAIDDLIDNQVFNIKLDKRGEPKRSQDLKLLEDIRSNTPSRSVPAILDIIYSIRCNMFHGHKDYHEIQTRLLIPVLVLLEKISTALYEKLNNP